MKKFMILAFIGSMLLSCSSSSNDDSYRTLPTEMKRILGDYYLSEKTVDGEVISFAPCTSNFITFQGDSQLRRGTFEDACERNYEECANKENFNCYTGAVTDYFEVTGIKNGLVMVNIYFDGTKSSNSIQRISDTQIYIGPGEGETLNTYVGTWTRTD